jgi:hypothetical protein
MKGLAEPASLLQPISLAEQMIKIASSSHCRCVRSRDDSVGITTGYGLNSGVLFPAVQDFTPLHVIQMGPRNLLFNGYLGLFPGG